MNMSFEVLSHNNTISYHHYNLIILTWQKTINLGQKMLTFKMDSLHTLQILISFQTFNN